MKNKHSAGHSAKAAIYCRVSTDDQTQGTSLNTQEAECRAFAEGRGLEVVSVFKGEGESAKTTQRPAFQEMLKFCTANKGKVEAVIVWKLDRFSRNAGDANTEKAKLAKIGIQVYSATEPALNEDNPAARLTFTVLTRVPQFDNEIRGERARLGMKRRAEEGCWPFRSPFGIGIVRREVTVGSIVSTGCWSRSQSSSPLSRKLFALQPLATTPKKVCSMYFIRNVWWRSMARPSASGIFEIF